MAELVDNGRIEPAAPSAKAPKNGNKSKAATRMEINQKQQHQLPNAKQLAALALLDRVDINYNHFHVCGPNY
jgi:hypothetical protein